MSTIKLGRLEEVDVRKLWSHEQYDFSNWFAMLMCKNCADAINYAENVEL